MGSLIWGFMHVLITFFVVSDYLLDVFFALAVILNDHFNQFFFYWISVFFIALCVIACGSEGHRH